MHSQEGKFARCRVCGDYAVTGDQSVSRMRCKKHAGRNPCAIEGCSRSTDAKGDLDRGQNWLCGVHWKMGVPPRSLMRRQYHRYFRLAKKHGWEASIGRSAQPLRIRFWMFWHRTLIPRARKRCEHGDMDIAEIHRMFGWDNPEN